MAILLAAGGLLAGDAFAQEPRPTVSRQPSRILAPKIPVIRGEGTPAPRETFEGGRGIPPRELTIHEKNALLSGIAVVLVDQGPWRVSPEAPLVEGRADLAYMGPYMVDLTSYDAPAAYFLSKSTWTSSSPGPLPRLKLRFRPPAKGSYLIDCRVRNDGENYEVEVYPGGSKQNFAGVEHLVVLYQAVDTSPVELLVTADHPEDKAWKFYGCEITPLK